MSFLSNVEAIWQKDETWVIQFFATVKKDIAIAEADALIAINWLSAHGTEIASDVVGVVGIAAAVGLGIPAPVALAVSLLNSATAAVNMAAAAAQAVKASGGSDLTAVIVAGSTAYQKLKEAQVATAQAQAHVASGGTA